ncbi:MAG: hypothetical protein ACREHG_02030 [Candidatus Saccharimonadales bacterium]
MENYKQYLQNQIIQGSGKQDSPGKVIGLLLGGFASSLIAGATTRTDYIFLSTYDSDIGSKHMKVVGILNNFIPITSSGSPHEATHVREETFRAVKRYAVSCASTQGMSSVDLSELRDWAGRYPTHSFGDDTKQNFFKVPQIERRLRYALSESEYEKVASKYSVESPIELIGNYLLISRCKPHMCGSERALVAVGLNNGYLFVMLTGASRQNVDSTSKRCFTTDHNFMNLPPKIRKRFKELSEATNVH